MKSQKRLFEINRYIGKRREKHCKIFNFHFIYIYTSQILFLSLRESTIRIKVRQVELQYFQNCTDIFNNNPLSPPEEIFSYYYDPLTYLTESQRFSSSSVVSGGGKENQSYIVFSLLYCIEIGVCSKSSTTTRRVRFTTMFAESFSFTSTGYTSCHVCKCICMPVKEDAYQLPDLISFQVEAGQVKPFAEGIRRSIAFVTRIVN